MNFLKILLMIPGTILHELLHFIVGLILNAKPVHFTIIPKKTNKGYVLGSVAFKNINSINALPVALAPFLSIIPILFLYKEVQQELSLQIFFLYCYFIWTLGSSMIPSSQDFKVLFSKPLGIIFYGLISYGIYFYYLNT